MSQSSEPDLGFENIKGLPAETEWLARRLIVTLRQQNSFNAEAAEQLQGIEQRVAYHTDLMTELDRDQVGLTHNLGELVAELSALRRQIRELEERLAALERRDSAD
ncbi:MAG: hypothetical protein GXY52_05170 [Chloroflexi bacterium]|nr:hypothetical protein [Chloroflexota bacterium]